MNELNSSLTTTGLIATFISLLFASAAVYISSKKKAPRPPRPAPPPVTPQGPSPQPFSTAAQTDPGQAASPATLPTSGAPVFKRLGSRGLENPVGEAEKTDNRYVWK